MTKKKRDIEFVSPYDIEFNPDNPRGQNYDDKNFIALEESIRLHEVMVPLIVFKNEGRGKPYILLDGERRLKAAQKVKCDKVPVHILDKRNKLEGLSRMFQIHMLREQWEPIAQAQSLEFYVDQIRNENKKISDAELIKKISNITKMDKKTIADRLRLLKFDKQTQSKVMDNKLDDSYLVQIEQNFIEQLDKSTNFFKERSKTKVRKVLVEKAEKGLLGTARAFFWVPGTMKVCKKLNKIEAFASSAKIFIDNIENTVEDLKNDLTKKVPIPTLTDKVTTRSLTSNINKLCSQLNKYEIDKELNEKRKTGIIVSLKKLNKSINLIIKN